MDHPTAMPAHHRRLVLRLGGLSAVGAVAGCGPLQRGPAVPRAEVTEATVLGLPNERFLIPHDMPALLREYEAAFLRRQARHGGAVPRYEMLGISGGGEDGAFGAGLLNAWSEHGTRPAFDLVTGVSTGALTAPFAFIGSSADAALRTIYTNTPADRVLRSRGLLAAVTHDAMADTEPLFRTISGEVDERMMAAIAEGYRDGRLLFVGTAQLDAQVPVTWNVGAIAASGHPGALNLLRRILLASASIPGAFPPVMFDVTVNGRPHQEMHVDGGAFSQVFLYPRRLTELRRMRMTRRDRVVPARAFIIRNARLDADWAEVDRRTLTIAGRAIATMIASAGYNDVLRIWSNTQRDGVDFNLAFIGPDFDTAYTEPFDQVYMRALYEYGFARARHGYPWAQVPPG
jgi:hypothetical protein